MTRQGPLSRSALRDTGFAVLRFLLLSGLLSILLHRTTTWMSISSLRLEGGGYRIPDFLYWLVVIRAYWAGSTDSFYTVDSNFTALSKFFGTSVAEIMPVGISPTAAILFYPFVRVSDFGLPLALTLWNSLSLSVLVISLTKTVFRTNLQDPKNRGYLLLLLLPFCSYSFLSALVLGQTVILATALLLLMYLDLESSRPGTQRKIRPACVLATLVLSVKAPYLLFAFALLLSFGEFLTAAASAGLLGFSAIFLASILGPGIITGWLGILGAFTEPTLPGPFLSSLVWETIVTFRSAFSARLGHTATLAVSGAVLLAGTGGLFLTARRFGRAPSPPRTPGGFPPPRIREWIVLSYFSVLLLFLPYLNGVEDLLFLVCLALAFRSSRDLPVRGWDLVLPALLLVPLLNHNLRMPPGKPMMLLWLGKVLLCLSLQVPFARSFFRERRALRS